MRGATGTATVTVDDSTDFNPHSPCGERLTRLPVILATIIFQSTLPMRGATPALRSAVSKLLFQSTLPMRGATQADKLLLVSGAISIHTPHAGSDLLRPACTCPALPISIHTPHAGSDSRVGSCAIIGHVISIHTPHAGSDSQRVRSRLQPADFNPHSPCGERRCRAIRSSGSS